MLGVGRSGPLRRADEVDAGAGAWLEPAHGQVGLDATERDAWVVLDGVEGVGPVGFGRLLAAFGSAGAILGAATSPGGRADLVEASRSPDGGSAALTPAAARAVADAARHPEVTLGPLRRSGVEVLTLADPDYPSRLRRVDLPPPVLFVRGSLAALDASRAVAIVGTRRPTVVGRGTAARIAEAVATLGASVISGLAVGIDAAAHAAALRVGGTTVAVIGGGHERLYPRANRGLAEGIVRDGGAVISEFHPGTIPTRGTFPRRNRIVSGLADATIVVEAGARSGALTTAAWALEQGRGLYIVPGRLDDPAVAGSLAFLREAGPEATVVAGVPELLEDLDLVPGEASGRRVSRGRRDPATPDGVLASLPAVERAIAIAVAAGRGSVDELVAMTGLAGATVLGALTALEVRGVVVEAFGRYRAAGALAGSPGSRRVWRGASHGATLPETRQPTPI